MRFSVASVLFLGATLVAAGSVPEDSSASHRSSHSLSRTGNNLKARSNIFARASGDEHCSGRGVTCQSCFGSGFKECPDDSSKCYNPDDPKYSSCSSSSGGSSGGSSSGSSGGSSGGSDSCSGRGVTCQSCFGSGYKECPNDSTKCYNPDDPKYSSCDPSSGSGGSGGSGGNSGGSGGSGGPTDESCARQYGTGNKVCGTDSCYNPTVGETCCQNTGSHCDLGRKCSKSGTLCCAPGSRNPDCRGIGSDDSTTTSSSTSTSTSGSSYPTSTNVSGSSPSSSPDTPQSNGAGCLSVNVFPILAGGLGVIAAL
ncbi:hypothetical protein TESG_03639 [Trichophyton tonsurans CBS 112818]|uniref:GPI anchored protein n=1 Tax=Trichophyton tonsurans (strain CBS 112818) TaxID=647933 RepID=F2RXY7_TRIT1|nr:hypothetical protein TESG_03639 [Trichophyton tonsurans CBS 112818]